MSQVHHRSYSGFPTATHSEDIEGQIDRLNQALQTVMKEIEISSVSRNASRLSALNYDFATELEQRCATPRSEDACFPDGFESKIEELLISIDRNEMVIEDYRSEEIRRSHQFTKEKSKGCNHDINRIRKEVWLQVTMQKNVLIEKERKNFEDKLEMLDRLKEDYLMKRSEIVTGIDKLKIKEDLLQQKERDLRIQRMAFDKHKLLWEQEHGLESTTFTLPEKPAFNPHVRANSFSAFTSPWGTPKKEAQGSRFPEGNFSQLASRATESQITKAEQLKALQSQLSAAESALQESIKSGAYDHSDLEMRVDSLKNKVAAIRGEIAISDSLKATRIISTMMTSIEKEVDRSDKAKRLELIDAVNKKMASNQVTLTDRASKNIPVRARPVHSIQDNEVNRKVTALDAPTPLKEDNERIDYDYKRRMLMDKERELQKKEMMLQQTWMKVPGAKALIENVNLTLSKLNSEKAILDRERDEFEKERVEWIKSKENSMKGMRKL